MKYYNEEEFKKQQLKEFKKNDLLVKQGLIYCLVMGIWVFFFDVGGVPFGTVMGYFIVKNFTEMQKEEEQENN